MNTLNNLDTFLDVAAQRFSYSNNNAIALELIEQYTRAISTTQSVH